MTSAPLFLALRYLRPTRSFISVITVISILGVAAGVMALVIALAVSEGRLTAEQAADATLVDELYQVGRWGDDPLAEKHREGVRKDIASGARFLALLEKQRLRGRT